jgi:anti-sigma factor NepR-like protein
MRRAALKPQGQNMNEDDELSVGDDKRNSKPEPASALPAQLGKQLRSLFADVEAQPVPDRLRELLEALAAKEKKAE